MFKTFLFYKDRKDQANEMEQKLIDCAQYSESNEVGTSKLQFMDLCDDVIEIIFGNLYPEELANCTYINKRINRIVQSIYSRKYGNLLLSIDNIAIEYKRLIEPIKINVTDARCFKLIRNFGKFIRIIHLEGSSAIAGTSNGALERNLFLHNKLIEYILEYCTDSLEDITLKNCPFFKFNKPQKKLHSFTFQNKFEFGHDCSESIKWITNLRCFKVIPALGGSTAWNEIPKALEMCIPTLKEVQLLINSYDSAKTFIEFLKMNPQIETLSIIFKIHKLPPKCSYHEIFFSVAQYSQIKHLRIKFIDLVQSKQIEILRFKTVEMFTFDRFAFIQTMGYNDVFIAEDYIFDELKELNFGCYPFYNIDSYFMRFALRQKKLKKICFYEFYSMDENNFHELQNELPELKEIVFNCQIEGKFACTSSQSMLKTNFSSDWIMTETIIEQSIDFIFCNKNERRVVLKFQRI